MSLRTIRRRRIERHSRGDIETAARQLLPTRLGVARPLLPSIN